MVLLISNVEIWEKLVIDNCINDMIKWNVFIVKLVEIFDWLIKLYLLYKFVKYNYVMDFVEFWKCLN